MLRTLHSTPVRADRATLDRIDALAARAGFASRSAYLVHAGLHHGDGDDEALVRALAAVAQALHRVHADALAQRPALPPDALADLARRTRRALAAVAERGR